LYLKGKAFYALSNEVLTTLLLQKIRTIREKNLENCATLRKNAKTLKQRNLKTLQAIKFKIGSNASFEKLSGFTCFQQNPFK